MKIYIAGKITDDPNYRAKFAKAEKQLANQGHSVMNPAVLPDGFKYDEYFPICFAMISTCDAIFLMRDWKDSAGAIRERTYAELSGKRIIEEGS